jgi:AraC family transcriptional activator of mtrCDE
VAEGINIEDAMVTERSNDALCGLARLLRVRPELQHVCQFGAQWASDHAAEPNRWAPFHFITKGACVVELRGLGRTIALSAGDAVILPHGTAHSLRGPTTLPGASGPFGIRSHPIGSIGYKTNIDGEPEAQLVCGRLRFESAHDNLVLAALPDAIVVSAANDSTEASRLHTLMSTIEEELRGAQVGAQVIATDLASALFVMVVRIYLCRKERSTGLLRLLADRKLGRTVAAMMEDPVKSWTLDELATLANTSRACLVRRFREAAQQSPVAFLTGLRLELARSKLSSAALPVAAVAGEVGYTSESAFSRAFYRRFGVRPGQYGRRTDL